MMKLLHVALVAPGGYSNTGIMNGFLANGVSDYKLFDYQLHIYNGDKDNMRRMLIREAESMDPDMIFLQIQSSEMLDVETFQTLSKISFTSLETPAVGQIFQRISLRHSAALQ